MANSSSDNTSPATTREASKDGIKSSEADKQSTSSSSGQAPKIAKAASAKPASGKFGSSDKKIGDGSKGVYAGDLKRGRGMFIFTLLFLSVIGYGLYLIWKPQDLADVSLSKVPAGDLFSEIKSTYETGGVIKIDQARLNRWLQDNVESRQEGVFGDFVAIKSVQARLHDGYMELLIVRDIAGYLPQTVALYMSFKKNRDHRGVVQNQLLFEGPDILGFTKAGGRMGSLNVPQGYLMLSIDAFNHLGSAFEKELGYIMSRMQHIKVTKGYIELSRNNINPS